MKSKVNIMGFKEILFNKRMILISVLILIVLGVSEVNAAEFVIKLDVNGTTFDVKLENNEATKALVDKLKKENVTIHAKEYGNFEKVGDLGFSLPTEDKRITTSPGDLVLYNGDEVSLFYNSNTWEYTKLGKIQDVNEQELKNVLGTGDVTLNLSLK